MGRKRGRYYSFSLAWRKYYEFVLEGEMFYLIEKAYTTPCHNAMIEWETITEETYRNATRKRYKPRVVIVEEEVLITPTSPLALIYEQKYDTDIDNIEKAIYKAREYLGGRIHDKDYTTEKGYREFIEKMEGWIERGDKKTA